MSIADTELFSEQSTPNSSVVVRFRKTSSGAYARYETYDADGVASHYGMTVLSPSTYATLTESVATGFFVTPQYIGWRKDAASPTLIHQPQTSDVATSALTITSQGAYASATGANRNSGNLVLNIPAPAAGGTAGACYVNISAADRFRFTTTAFTSAASTINFAETASSPTLSHDIKSVDSAPTSLTISSQAPYASATGANRNPGNIVLSVPAPAAGGADGYVGIAINAADVMRVSPPQVFIANTTAAPAGTPVGGGYLYVEAGALKYKGSSGTVTPLANA